MALKFSSWLTPHPFETALESRYQSDLRDRLFKQIKLSVLIGTAVFFSFFIFDIIDFELHDHLLIRLSATSVGTTIWLYIHKKPALAKSQIFHLSFLTAGLVMIVTLSMLSTLDSSRFVIACAGIMIIIAYIYGPLFTPIIPATIISLSSVFVVLLIGIRFAVPVIPLSESAFDLSMMIIVSAFSRYQLEVFSRRSFLDKRTADLERAVANEKRQLAEQATLEKINFLRNASHNLRQPTQALSSYSLLLDRALQHKNMASANEAARNVSYAIDLLADAFNKILNISKIDNDNYEPNITDVSINEFLETIQRQYTRQAEQKGIRLKVVQREKLPLMICTDKLVLQQILGNLVDNAIKYTNSGWVLISTTKSSKGIRIHIIDSGIGISTDHRQAIFKEFFRSNEQSEEQGMGIGLSYVDKAIHHLPKHQLGYSSTLDRGTHFYIDTPAYEEQPINTQPQEKTTVYLESGKYILLVDDNKMVLDAIGKQLTAQGCIIEKAASVSEMKQILKEQFRSFDLVITDLRLGDGETAETIIRNVHNASEKIPIIILTGEMISEETISLLDADYPLLKKPVSNEQLLQAIAHALI